MKNIFDKENKGAVMVEAAIYIPIVLCMVIALIELAIFNMQEYLMMYEAQRISTIVSRDVAYEGYSHLNAGQNNEIDLEEFPSSDQITDYYQSYHEKISSLYREVSGVFAAATKGETDTSKYNVLSTDAVMRASLIAIGNLSTPNIKVDNGLLGSGVTVTFIHEIPVPGVIRYLGYEGSTNLRVAAYTYSVNPSEFARNVNLATDLVDYVFEKLNLSGGYSEFKSKIYTVLDKIL